eukprot:819221_1
MAEQNDSKDDHKDEHKDDHKNVEYSVDDAINEIGKGPYFGVGLFQVRLLFLTGAVWAADAMEMMLLSFLLPTLAKELYLSCIIVSFIGSIVFFGMLIGGIILSIAADKIGRQK